MSVNLGGVVQSTAVGEFSRIMQADPNPRPERARADANGKNGLGQLVLTLVKLLHELLERQAIRRMESGSLTEAEVERLGVTLLRQTQEIDRLRIEFGLDEADLNLDLGPLGKLL